MIKFFNASRHKPPEAIVQRYAIFIPSTTKNVTDVRDGTPRTDVVTGNAPEALSPQNENILLVRLNFFKGRFSVE